MRCAIAGMAILFLASAVCGDGGVKSEQRGQFRIVVPDLASDKGVVIFYVHDSSTFVVDNLKKREAADDLMDAAVEITEREAVWTTEPLPYGDYALVAHHDVNGDRVVNFARILPSEPLGYSNYDQGIAAYPDFDKARVTLDTPLREVRIEAFMQGRIFRKTLKQ